MASNYLCALRWIWTVTSSLTSVSFADSTSWKSCGLELAPEGGKGLRCRWGFFAVSQDTESRHREKQGNQPGTQSLAFLHVSPLQRDRCYWSSIIFILLFIFICMVFFSLYMCACALWSPEEGVRSLGTRVTNGCEPICRCWESNPGLKAANAYKHQTISPVPPV